MFDKAKKYAESSSDAEKNATKAERDAEDIKKAEFMEDKIGNEYMGIVSSITNFGMFVELESTVEGLIRFENMGSNEYFVYDENRKTLVGERTNRVFKIGDTVRIRVIEANKALRKVAFELIADKNIVEHDFFFMDNEGACDDEKSNDIVTTDNNENSIEEKYF